MKILAADDEFSALKILENAIKKCVPDGELFCTDSAEAAVSCVKNGFYPDAAFLDIEMPVMNGIELAKRLKDIAPNINIVFVTGQIFKICKYRKTSQPYITSKAPKQV